MQYLKCFAFAIVMISFLSVASHASDCTRGSTRQEHRVGNFNFVTNSFVEEAGKLMRYVSCVGNFDSGTDLLVNWYIAGPFNTYVPSDDVAYGPRMSDDLVPIPINGCIKYGNLGDHTPAQFMGTAAEQAENGKGSPCVVAQSTGDVKKAEPGVPEGGYEDVVRVFFPSNRERPRETMLVVDGKIGLSPTGDGYVSYFSYTAQPYKDRPDGNPEQVRVRPAFPFAQDIFLKAFYNSNSEAVPLQKEGKISFIVASAGKDWIPVPAFYEFIDESGELLGAIRVPVFGPPS
jgi:hypothetical protein